MTQTQAQPEATVPAERRYQIYIDRDDGLGPVLDGCWGSEHAQFDNEAEATEAAEELEEQWPGCSFVVQEIEDEEDES